MEAIFLAPGSSLDNGAPFSRSLTPGRCNGLSCAWASATIKHGGVRYEGMIESWKANIGQQAYEQQGHTETQALEASGLQVVARGELQNWSSAVAAAAMCAQDGTFFVDVKGNAGGHALGFRNAVDKTGQRVYDYYDPNVGLARTYDVNDFRATVTALLSAVFFNGLHDKMRFFKVQAA